MHGKKNIYIYLVVFSGGFFLIINRGVFCKISFGMI